MDFPTACCTGSLCGVRFFLPAHPNCYEIVTALCKKDDHMTTSLWTFRGKQSHAVEAIAGTMRELCEGQTLVGVFLQPRDTCLTAQPGCSRCQLPTQLNTMWITNIRV